MTESVSALDASTLVIIPTFNEIENLPRISSRVREAQPGVHILVVDDNSPDGTGELADKLAADDDHIHVPVSYTHLTLPTTPYV